MITFKQFLAALMTAGLILGSLPMMGGRFTANEHQQRRLNLRKKIRDEGSVAYQPSQTPEQLTPEQQAEKDKNDAPKTSFGGHMLDLQREAREKREALKAHNQPQKKLAYAVAPQHAHRLDVCKEHRPFFSGMSSIYTGISCLLLTPFFAHSTTRWNGAPMHKLDPLVMLMGLAGSFWAIHRGLTTL